MSQLPFPFGGGTHFQPAHHQTVHNNMPPSNPAAPSSIPQTQQAFMQNSQLPGIDMATVLQGITPEQLAYIGRLYQSGQIPLPSAQDSLVTQPVPNTQAAMSENIESLPADGQEVYPTAIGQSNANGEHTKQDQRGFLHPPPTAPRKRSGSVHMRPDNSGVDKRTKRHQSPPRQPQGYDRRRPEPRADDQTSSPARSNFRQRKAKQDAAKEFILSLRRAGYVFDDIAQELNDARMLRVIFQELGLDAPAEKPQSTQAQSTPVAAHARGLPLSAAATPAQGSPLNVTALKPAPKAASKPLATAPAPVSADRSAYLAKLQAAKNKKNESQVAASKSPAPATSQNPEAQQPAAPNAMLVSSQPLVQQQASQQPKKATVQTELIRKRLEALKAEQARRQEAERLANAAATSAPVIAPVIPSIIQSATETPIRSTNATPQVASPAPAQQSNTAVTAQSVASPAPAFDFTSQFPGLPGLFMTGTPTQVSVPASKPATLATSIDVSQPASSPESGLVTSGEPSPSDEAEADFPMYEASLPTKVSATSSGQITPKHSFNQNRYDSNDDSVIIQVTDDEESELDDMGEDDDDIDDEVAPSPAAKAAAPTAKPGLIRNLPAPTISSSTPATPGAITPGGTLYERKMQEINEMNRRIAEMQKAKAKLNSPAVPQAQASSALPGLGNSLGNVPAPLAMPSVPVEQQLAESSQQIKAKLAQLDEEAEIISEQTHSPSRVTHVDSEQPHKDAKADSTTSSDDDDDAMDLSSGDDLDSDEQDNGIENTAPSAGEDSDEAAIPEGICANELAMMSDSNSDSEDSSMDSEEESDEEYEPAPAAPVPETVSSTSTLQASPHDIDLAPELQPAPSEQVPSNATPEVGPSNKVAPHLLTSKAQATTKPLYTPYESPLRMFKDYRFHPKFNSDIQGGFKSLTYSNKLDPTEPMCPNELSSGTCQDPACLHQHFSTTAINDGELLKDLGTRNAPWKTEEEKLRWNNGLSEVVKQLRNSNQGTDVNAIAARIAQYRREFIGIPDQVLSLNPA